MMEKVGELSRWKRLLLFLAVLGPGIITANVDNDPGGITTYSVAGASFGYKLLWVFIPMTLALIVVQEMSARMGAVTGKGLGDLIRERYGVRVTVLIVLGLILSNFGNTLSEFAGVAASGEILGLPRALAVPVVALLVWGIVIRGSYQGVERVFLLASALYLCYVPSAFMAKPDWGLIAKQMVTPTFSLDPAYLTLFIGLIGTTIAPWMQFYLQSAVVEKGITVKRYRYSRLDIILGCWMTDLVAVFIVVACAATLYTHHIHIETAQDAALALAPLAGRWASVLFAFGLLNASIFSASILPLATAYSVCEALGLEAGIDKRWGEAPVFYWLYTFLIVAGAGLVLLPHLPLIPVMLWSQVVNGILLPFTLIFMLLIVNNRDLMGQYVNSRGFNGVAWTTAVVMIALTCALIVLSMVLSR